MVCCWWQAVPPAPAETVKIGHSSGNPKTLLRGVMQQALQAVPPAFLEASAGHPEGSPEAVAARAGVKAFTVSDTGVHSNTRPVLLSSKMQLLVQELLSRKVRAGLCMEVLLRRWSSFALRSVCSGAADLKVQRGLTLGHCDVCGCCYLEQVLGWQCCQLLVSV